LPTNARLDSVAVEASDVFQVRLLEMLEASEEAWWRPTSAATSDFPSAQRSSDDERFFHVRVFARE
jgi:hypothetical protein